MYEGCHAEGYQGWFSTTNPAGDMAAADLKDGGTTNRREQSESLLLDNDGDDDDNDAVKKFFVKK